MKKSNNESTAKTALPPVVYPDSQILILGTMPGEESLRKQQYYGHPNNQFWKIMASLFNASFSNYTDKMEFVKDHKIALWDVLASCERKGSLDSAIKNAIPNDFNSFFTLYPSIKTIFFNSKKAEELYTRHIGKTDDKKYYVLPSPSPANARLKFEEKLQGWKIVLENLQ